MMLGWAFELARPEMLWLLCCAVPVAWYFRRSLVDFSKRQQRGSLGARLVVLTLLVLAAAGLSLVRSDDRQFVVFLVDRSDSIDTSAGEQADEFIARAAEHRRRGDQVRIIDFAGNTLLPREVEAECASLDDLDRGHTDLASALSVAWASIPAFYAKTLVVLSDGRFTRGDAARVAQAARAADVRICTTALQPRRDDEVQLSAVTGPAQVRTGAPFELEIEITSNHDDDAELDIFRNDVRVGAEKVEIKTGENRFRLLQAASDAKLQAYSVRLRAGRDHFIDNNTATALIACEGKPRMLLIESAERSDKHLKWALEREDIVVDVRRPRGVPQKLDDLENFELLCLSNVPATELSRHQMQLIRSYVQDLGGGFIMIGGDQSFGLGGYYKTILEEILPVRSDFEKEKEKPSLGMVLVIDKSGSMGGQKIELAKEAAKSAAELLGPKDQIGVLAFDGSPHWVCEVHPASDRGYVVDRISSLVAGGGTDLAPALSEAYLALEGTSTKLKHVIALTDGHSQPGNFFEIASSMADSKMTISTVAVGAGADRELLERIVEWGGRQGNFYFTEDEHHIPQIFAKETIEASRSAIEERPFLPVQVREHQICRGVNFDEAACLLGYVIARAKPTAELVLATEQGDPLLATWRYGLGKSLAFTSDAKSKWAAEWLRWPGFSRFWSQVVRDTMRTTTPATMQVEMQRDSGKVMLTVDALHPSPQRAGEYLDDVVTTLALIRPGREEVTVPLNQHAPGRYVGEFAVDGMDDCQLRISQKRKGVEVQSARRGLALGYSDEYRVGPVNEASLRQLAEIGGGTFNVEPGDVFRSNARSIRVQPLWPYLIAAALILLVIDVALRRIDFSVVFATAGTWKGAPTREV